MYGCNVKLLLVILQKLSRARILISDFGECENIFNASALSRRTGATGTLEFTAPELLRGIEIINFWAECFIS
jgi:serine/threonine protein kinase